MSIVYALIIRFYRIMIGLVSLWNPKAKNWIVGRKDWKSKLNQKMGTKENIHWFHCASLGEFEQARPLIEKIKSEKSSSSILVSFFSPSGYEQRKNYELADYVCYLPLDTKRNTKKFISSLNITKAFFVKYEVWPNYFKELNRQKIDFYIISATFRKSQIYFKPTGIWFKNLLKLPTQIFVQEEASKILLSENNIESIVSGDTRYDRVLSTSKKSTPNPIIEQFYSSKFTLIAGSSWEKEEELILKAFYASNSSFKVVFAPHDISESHVKGIVDRVKKESKYIKYSDIKEGVNLQEYDILILDNIGLLSNAYQYGSVAFIGGGFNNALHNILEPATFGLPVFYGNNHEKFPEANDMKLNGAGVDIEGYLDFEKELELILEDKELLAKKMELNKNFIQSRTGATKLIYTHCI